VLLDKDLLDAMRARREIQLLLQRGDRGVGIEVVDVRTELGVECYICKIGMIALCLAGDFV
jgi:hypothetical protein